MTSLSRRAFIGRSGAAVAATGVVAATGSTVASSLTGEAASAASEEPAVFDAAASSEPVVAHVDPNSGEIDLFYGEHHVTVDDPAVANRLFKAVS